MGASAFEIVFVCTGNRARSPLAEALFRRRIGMHGAQVRSLGMSGAEGMPALPGALRAGSRLGVDLTQHRSRTLRPFELENADLVVGFEPGHVSGAVVDGRADATKTFSLIELGELLDGFELDRGSAPETTIRAAHAQRTGSFLTAPSLADPLGASDAFFEQMADSIEAHIATIADVLFGPSVRR